MLLLKLPGRPTDPQNGTELVRAVHDRYHDGAFEAHHWKTTK